MYAPYDCLIHPEWLLTVPSLAMFSMVKESPEFIPLLVYLHAPPTFSFPSSQADYWTQALVDYYPEQLKNGVSAFSALTVCHANCELQVPSGLLTQIRIVLSRCSRISFPGSPAQTSFRNPRYDPVPNSCFGLELNILLTDRGCYRRPPSQSWTPWYRFRPRCCDRSCSPAKRLDVALGSQ